MTISLGGKTFELHTARAETDDACWVWIPDIKTCAGRKAHPFDKADGIEVESL